LNGNKDIINQYDIHGKDLLEKAMTRNYTVKYFCLLYGFEHLVFQKRFVDNIFHELSCSLDKERYDNSSKTKEEVMKLWLKYCPYIEVIDIRSQRLESIPDEVYSLTNLKELMICGNYLKGILPKIKHLKTLKKIGFCGMEHVFHIPHEIGELKDTLIDVCISSRFRYSGVKTRKELQTLLPKTYFH
jgi:Leucine-rich repeat (LRR) protein